MKRELREKVWNKYGRRCAYCGKEITYKQFQVDHIDPIFRVRRERRRVASADAHVPDKIKAMLVPLATNDSEDNLNPSCARCNNWKHAMPLDTFKSEIAAQVERLKRDRPQFRLALDYGLVVETGTDVVFYFERNKKANTEKEGESQ